MNPVLVEAVRERRVVLFAGAGLSACLGLPTWRRLLEKLASELDFDPDVFASYGESWALAEYYLIRKGGLGPLRSWMDTEWHRRPAEEIAGSEAHRLLVELDFPVIYTTNYDRWLEHAYAFYGKPYRKVVSVRDLAALRGTPETPIVKFHGDFDDDGSIVLAESHYLTRMELESPLDVRLRSDLLGKTALFVGYSLSDPNMRRLLFRLREVWRVAGIAEAQPRSFLFSSRPNPVQETVLASWGITMLHEDEDNPGKALVAFLSALVAAVRR